jgi:Fic family protein
MAPVEEKLAREKGRNMVGMAADWAKAYNKLSRALEERRALLEAFGGMDLDLIQVANEEWLYMLQEDTRHSLAIEGYFTDERELRQVLSGQKRRLRRWSTTSAPPSSSTSRAFQDALEDVWHLDLAFINNIHGQLFPETLPWKRERGKPADGVERRIQGAKVVPPVRGHGLPHGPSSRWPGPFRRSVPRSGGAWPRATPSLRRSIPYRDGNGRVGRLLLNYLAIRQGLPPVVIKGLDAGDRERYYEALERGGPGPSGPSFPPS